MREDHFADGANEDGIMAGDRRISRTDTALPDWYVSDAAYRPIPIAWFAGALVFQVLLQPAIVYLGWAGGSDETFIVLCAIGATGAIWLFTQRRGMAEASLAWRVATIVMLLFFLSITAISLFA
ncbi:MAG: hypothetical protein MK010_10060 [Erythrobacter sp.]|nr:hypothetical protein [Erythrobacter sp.]